MGRLERQKLLQADEQPQVDVDNNDEASSPYGS